MLDIALDVSLLTPDQINQLIEKLEATGHFRIAEKVTLEDLMRYEPDGRCKEGVLLDTETTSLDTEIAKVIELGLIRFAYDPATMEILGVTGTLSMLEDPGEPLSEETKRVTGLTDEMVAGHKIDDELVANMIEGVQWVVAHNAEYDRKVVERRFPGMFEPKSWACSYNDVPWGEEGFGTGKLDYLAYRYGMFYGAHRAINDCVGLFEILRCELPSGAAVFKTMIETAAQDTCDIWATNSPFETKDTLKARGYKWNGGEDGRPKAWHIIVREPQLQEELQWLRDEIYPRDVNLPVDRIDALTRYSNRKSTKPAPKRGF